MPTSRVIALAALAALAGCQTQGMGPGAGPVVATPSGVEGDWLSTDGVALSRFTGGTFETLATDTNNKLSQGTYRYTDNRTVAIDVTSIIRQTQSTVNCALVTPQQLNCTSSSGQQFVLVRRQASG